MRQLVEKKGYVLIELRTQNKMKSTQYLSLQRNKLKTV